MSIPTWSIDSETTVEEEFIDGKATEYYGMEENEIEDDEVDDNEIEEVEVRECRDGLLRRGRMVL